MSKEKIDLRSRLYGLGVGALWTVGIILGTAAAFGAIAGIGWLGHRLDHIVPDSLKKQKGSTPWAPCTHGR